MKKIILTVAALAASLAIVNAQETEQKESSFNKWSVELNAGITKPTTPFVSGAYVDRVSPLHLDLGVRYMFNPKFGLKLDGGFDQFKQGSSSSVDFENKYYRFSLQGVVNVGRVLNFEDWTNTIGLLAHAGAGYSMLQSDHYSGSDQMINFIAGLTGQVKLSDKFVLTGDLSMINNLKQNHTWDGTEFYNDKRGLEKNYLFNASIGITMYLGSASTHADWYLVTPMDDVMASLEDRISEIESMLVDSDKDGVPDYLDVEPNSTPGVAVDSKGRVIDRNGNGIPDELETYLERTYGPEAVGRNTKSNNELVKELINSGYVTVYFDFDKEKPTNVSTQGIDFIRTYLLNNANASVNIYGHADEIGNVNYNYGLANRRAENVKAILVKAGIDGNRLNVISKGEDKSVEPSSAGARKLVRRVTFEIK